jgi:hypothetical protein
MEARVDHRIVTPYHP